MGDDFVSFDREGLCGVYESSGIERDSHVGDLFGPGCDLNLALLVLFGSEGAVGVGVEDQGVVLHGFLLWAGGLGGEGLDEGREAGEQGEGQTAFPFLRWGAGSAEPRSPDP